MKAIAIVFVVLILVSCSGFQEDTDVFTAPTEKTRIIEETTAPPRDEAAADEAKRKAAAKKAARGGTSENISIDPNSPVAPDKQVEFLRLSCQALKAESAEGKEAVDAYLQQAINEDRTLAEILSELGYECTNKEIHDFQQQG